MQKVHIGYIEISPMMAQKIINKHDVTPDEVRDACQWPNRPVKTAWHDHPEYGRRLIAYGCATPTKLLKVILQPVDLGDGTWRLRTALASRLPGTS